MLCQHIAEFTAIPVPLWVLGPKKDSREMWTVIVDGGSWRPSTMENWETGACRAG